MKFNRGILWALGAALISGVSIYVNKFGVAQISDPFVYTTVKNTVVAFGLLAAVLALGQRQELRTFTRRQWLLWLGVGLIGGGVPFLLFFQGLSIASAASASLIQKTLFVWVALLAVPLLGEKLGLWQVAGVTVLAIGVYFLQPITNWAWGAGETLILIATLLWAVETIVAKKLLTGASARTAALGRMGVGVLVMWGFLGLTGRTGAALALNSTQWFWVLVTAVFLMGYVWTWYSALKLAPASLVTTVLTLGALITLALTALLENKWTVIPALWVIALMAIGVVAFLLPPFLHRRRMVETS
ncbi:MAG: DMT family transporter [Chloroflexi bacterium]|nr:DMT family transporter [Chloroflexota bacterium]